MNIPKELLYTKNHEWVRIDNSIAIVGITDYAQSELGDIIFVELPKENTSFNSGDSVGTIEAVKTVSDLFMPVSGEVLEFNAKLDDNPALINSDSYIDGWIVKISINNVNELEDLISSSSYQKRIN